MSDNQKILDIYLQEYDKLKDEQIKRIGFRDNLLYVTLGLFGGVISFAVSSKSNYYAFLVIPWVCIILGWTYVVNDEKISAIGRYIRLTLVKKIQQETGHSELESIFGWEIEHRSDKRRRQRKIEQLIVNLITFVISGVVALLAFWFLVPQPPSAIYILALLEFVLLLILGIEIFIYADLANNK
ncbi:MAG TPA: hypothetical protein V6D25_23790 [Leptolyngbyaceae cyanobacterium]